MPITTLSPLEIREQFAAPCYLSRVRTGFPSPADDYMDKKLDLNEFLIKHPASTFYCWTEGESMEGVGIYDRDLLIVDREEQARHQDVVLAFLDGELICKILDAHRRLLCSAHEDFPPIPILDGSDFQIEGVVINAIHFFRHRTG